MGGTIGGHVGRSFASGVNGAELRGNKNAGGVNGAELRVRNILFFGLGISFEIFRNIFIIQRGIPNDFPLNHSKNPNFFSARFARRFFTPYKKGGMPLKIMLYILILKIDAPGNRVIHSYIIPKHPSYTRGGGYTLGGDHRDNSHITRGPPWVGIIEIIPTLPEDTYRIFLAHLHTVW